jgi:hypothetical protein
MGATPAISTRISATQLTSIASLALLVNWAVHSTQSPEAQPALTVFTSTSHTVGALDEPPDGSSVGSAVSVGSSLGFGVLVGSSGLAVLVGSLSLLSSVGVLEGTVVLPGSGVSLGGTGVLVGGTWVAEGMAVRVGLSSGSGFLVFSGAGV